MREDDVLAALPARLAELGIDAAHPGKASDPVTIRRG